MKNSSYEQVCDYLIREQTKFYRLAYSYVQKEQDALDIVQNAICIALEKYPTMRNPAYIRTWFYRILVNESIAYRKKQHREILTKDLPEIIYEEPAYKRNNTFHELVKLLSDQERTILFLHYYEQFTLKEIATITKINLSTVKSKLYATLKKLRVLWKEDAPCNPERKK